MSSNRKRQWWERVSDRLRPGKRPRILHQGASSPQAGSSTSDNVNNASDGSDNEDEENFDFEGRNYDLPQNTPYEHKTIVLKDNNVTFYVIRTGFQRQR